MTKVKHSVTGNKYSVTGNKYSVTGDKHSVTGNKHSVICNKYFELKMEISEETWKKILYNAILCILNLSKNMNAF